MGAAVSAHSQPQSFSGSVVLGVKGWGDIRTKGVIGHPTVRCTDVSCPHHNLLLKEPHVVLTEKPYMGWKFTGWRGACKSKRAARCVVDASHAARDNFGDHSVHVRATFVPVAPGLTRSNPIPLGTSATIADGLVVRVNSANANVQLGTPPPAGAEYFDANLTVTNPSGTSKSNWWAGFSAEARNHFRYQRFDANGCSNPGPQPPLDTSDPLNAGQSATGYACWTIAAGDANKLELFWGIGETQDLIRTTWFALH